MTRWPGLLVSVVVFVGACAGGGSPPPRSVEAECPAGTTRTTESDSDVGWGEVEQTDGCMGRNGLPHGTVIEVISGGASASTRLVGTYADGRRVGRWTQYDPKTGRQLGTFTLDVTGSGIESVRDTLGHSRRGAVSHGKRDGAWTHHMPDGTVVARDLWLHGVFVRREGHVAWDPPMVDPNDACPEDGGGGDDGCPDVR